MSKFDSFAKVLRSPFFLVCEGVSDTGVDLVEADVVPSAGAVLVQGSETAKGLTEGDEGFPGDPTIFGSAFFFHPVH